MEQRRLRLGDILDDYCPRERRVTNHAVVAMIEEDVKQTRCTTCETEHAYKGGKAPRSRKKETPAALYREVLAGLSESDALPILTTPAAIETEPVVSPPEDFGAEEAPSEIAAGSSADEPPHDDEARPVEVEEGPVHRPLIRATLPRPEGQKDARPLPEFTVRHAGNRVNGNHREGGNRSRGAGGGYRAHGGQRFGGPRAGGRGQGGRTGGGFRSPQQPRHSGRKRSR
jgi:hypothetical protein